jgi:uncharacterized protein YbbK (DUF523 family)
MIVVVSACLAGINCKYTGGNNEVDRVVEIMKKGGGIPVCPEQLGGLTTPRLPAEIMNGDGYDVLDGKAGVRITETGEDVTAQFIRGAEETLKIVELVSPDLILFKQKSPSCGCNKIYNNRKLVKGDGITTALLKQHNYVVEAID